MHCPHSVIAWRNPWIYIMRHEKADYYDRTPLAEVLNPLRYEIIIKKPWRFTINRNGRAALWLANMIFRLKGKRP